MRGATFFNAQGFTFADAARDPYFLTRVLCAAEINSVNSIWVPWRKQCRPLAIDVHALYRMVRGERMRLFRVYAVTHANRALCKDLRPQASPVNQTTPDSFVG